MWNDDGKLSIRAKKILIYSVSFMLTVLLFFIVYRFFILKSIANTELYISAAAVILTIVGYILSITNDLIAHQILPKLNLAVDVNTINNHAIITCAIENKGQERIDPIAFYIFIDQPILTTDIGIYKANYIQKHDCNKNCKLSELCRTSDINEYPNEFKNQECEGLYYATKKLDFLAPDSMLYVNPGEFFSEDIVVKLERGVYRVLLICVFGKKGCLCANRQFIIEY